jgi:hypothetical protein
MPEARSSAAVPAPHSAPPTLRWAIWLLLAQAVALGAVAAFLVYEDLTAPASSARGAILVTVYVALMAGVLAVLGWALARRRRWARGPAIVLQMLLLPMGYTMVIGGLPWLGVPVLLVGVCGAGLLLAPATRAALGLG